jgi:hypothetical protein
VRERGGGDQDRRDQACPDPGPDVGSAGSVRAERRCDLERERTQAGSEEARREETGLSLRVRVDHPENASMSWNFSSRGGPVVLLNAKGEPLPAGRLQFMGGSSTTRYRIYHLQYVGGNEVPARVALEQLCVSVAAPARPDLRLNGACPTKEH